MSAKPNIKSAPGACKLRVVETETRDAIVTDVPPAVDGQPHNARTIAYVAIGAESWGPLLAAAPDMLDALNVVVDRFDYTRFATADQSAVKAITDMARAAIAKATS